MANAFVTTVLLGWIPVVLLLFCMLPPRRAVMVAFLFAWLFLPIAGIKFASGIPLYDKMIATCAGVLLAVFLFDARRIASFRPTLVDLPMALWCICPFITSISNDLGPYDGLAATFSQAVTWGVPYFIGRIYFRDLESLRELVLALFVGGLVYVPLCLLEIKISPQLHNWVYGFQQHSFVQTLRLGGWRPMVFMNHGLMVGMWMCMTGLIGLWLWYSGFLHRFRGLPLILAVAALLGTAILCKSTGAIILLAVGSAILFATYRLQWRGLIWALVLIAPLYMVARGSGEWDGALLRDASDSIAGTARADSLSFRMNNEDLLAARARERPFFGWGGWSRNRVFNQQHIDLTVTDGFWIIAFGINGIVGLSAWTLAMLLPASLVLKQFRVAYWRDPLIAPSVVLGVVVILYVVDCVPNAMTNPIFTVCVGGLASLASFVSVTTSQANPDSQLFLPVGSH